MLLPRKGERILPAVSGLLLAASFPPLHLLLLPFVGMVPFALWLEALPRGREGLQAAVRGSVAFGVVYFGALFHWIATALIRHTVWAVPAFLGVLAALTGLAALVGWALHRAVHGGRAPLWLALPVVWTAGEWFRAHWPGPLALPWLGLGTSLTGYPTWVGFAEIVGARGVTFWIVLVNGLLATLILARRAGRWRPGLLLALVLVLAVPPGWGAWRARTLPLRPAARVAVVQPDVAADTKRDPVAGREATLASLDRLIPRIEPGSADLVVLPEVTFSGYPRSEGGGWIREWTAGYARQAGAPLLFGALGFGPVASGRTARHNSAFLMEPGGLSPFQYDKRHLVPAVERIPWVPESVRERFTGLGGYDAGSQWTLAEVSGVRYGVLICYESAFTDGARAFRSAGADVLVNITNDAWFGRDPWWSRTTALWQHPAHLVMRAIEHRVGVVRSANTGISFFVDPLGRVHDGTALFTPDVRLSTVMTTDVLTVFTRFGDLVGRGAVLGVVLLLVAARIREGPARISASLDRNGTRH